MGWGFWLGWCCFSGLDGPGLVPSGVGVHVLVFCFPGFALWCEFCGVDVV